MLSPEPSTYVKEDHITAAKISPLRQPWKESSPLSIEGFTLMLVNSMPGIRQGGMSEETLKLLSALIKGAETSNTASNDRTLLGSFVLY